MTSFHSRQSDGGRCVQKIATASAFNFTPRISPPNLHGQVHEARKTRCNNFQRAAQECVMEMLLCAKQALPLVSTRFLRLANSSPKTARSPVRRSRDVREMSGKKSGEMSRVISAQRPGDGRTAAAAMPPNVRQDNSQDDPPCAGHGHAMSVPKTCETTRNLAAQQPRNILQDDSSESPVMFLTIPL